MSTESCETGVWRSAALVALVTSLAFLPVLGFPFLNWDDQDVFVRNDALRAPASPAWAFTTRYMEHYQPLAWLTWAGVDRTDRVDAGCRARPERRAPRACAAPGLRRLRARLCAQASPGLPAAAAHRGWLSASRRAPLDAPPVARRGRRVGERDAVRARVGCSGCLRRWPGSSRARGAPRSCSRCRCCRDRSRSRCRPSCG